MVYLQVFKFVGTTGDQGGMYQSTTQYARARFSTLKGIQRLKSLMQATRHQAIISWWVHASGGLAHQQTSTVEMFTTKATVKTRERQQGGNQQPAEDFSQ